MLYVILTALGFVASLFIQTSVIGALGSPLSFLPLHLAIGCVILHRGRMELGMAWLTLTPVASLWIGFIIGTWWSYIIIALFGPVLVLRIFAKRSLLALMGLNWSLYVLFSLLNSAFIAQPYAMLGWGLLLLTISILLINGIQQYTRRLSKRFVLVRHI